MLLVPGAGSMGGTPIGVGLGNPGAGAGETPIGVGITPAWPRGEACTVADRPWPWLLSGAGTPRTWAGESGARSANASIPTADVVSRRIPESYPLLGCVEPRRDSALLKAQS